MDTVVVKFVPPSTVADALRGARERKDWTLPRMAFALRDQGIPYDSATLAKMERGATAIPLAVAQGYARVLHAPSVLRRAIDELYRQVPDRPPAEEGMAA